jgi:serine/threonine-protein kinase HipA
MNTLAAVKIWGHKMGVILWDEIKNVGVFEFDKSFLDYNLDVAPLQIPLDDAKKGRRVFSFPFLNFETYKGWFNKGATCKVLTLSIDCAT